MNILEETFAAHEHLAPDSAEVLREVRLRTVQRRRRPSPRLLAVTGVGATVAAVAVGTVVVAGSDAPRAAHRTTSVPAATHTARPDPVPVQPAETRIPGPDHNTFGAGWLPSTTYTVSLASNSLQWGQEIEYDMRADGHDVTVLIQYDNSSTLEDQSKSGPADGTHGTYEGHPSVEWDSGGYWKFTYRRDATHTVIVEVIVDNAEGSGAAAIGRHVTRELRFDLDTPIEPGGYLTYLPAGVSLVAVDAHDSGIAWGVARTGRDEDLPLVQILSTDGSAIPRTIKLSGDPQPSSAPQGTPGRPVQGHPSYVEGRGQQLVLTVTGLLAGRTVQFFGSQAVPTLDELYAIADGLRTS